MAQHRDGRLSLRTTSTRRQALALLGSVATLAGLSGCVSPLPVASGAKRLPRVAFWNAFDPHGGQTSRAFSDGLDALGYREGSTINIEWRLQEEQVGTSITSTAAQLVQLGVDAIVVVNTPAIVAAAQATRTIPIVACLPHRPLLELGLVDSLAHPGHNVTGTEGKDEIFAKTVELLARVVPSMKRLGFLRNPSTPATATPMSIAQTAAERLGLQFVELQAHSLAELESTFATAATAGVQGLVVLLDGALTTGGNGSPEDPLFALPLRYRLPAIYGQTDLAVRNGGLIGYAPSIVASNHEAATFVDKILRGAAVASLPVEQATSFDLAINLKTADILGLTIPPDVLLQATELIQ